MIPQLSLQERDRRYKIVRAEMAKRGIDCLLLPANTGRWEQFQGDSRYLTTIGGFATAEVFRCFPVKAMSPRISSTARPGGNRRSNGLPTCAMGATVGDRTRSSGLANSACKKAPSGFPDSPVSFARRKESFLTLR